MEFDGGVNTQSISIAAADLPTCDVAFRVNAGGSLLSFPSGDFSLDSDVLPSSYLIGTSNDTFSSTAVLISNDTGYPDLLFQTERFTTPGDMNWEFPTKNGIYDVKILFNENWANENTTAANNRIFDVVIEGEVALDNYRPSGPAGTDFNVAKVESYLATVTDGVLNIDFEKINQNPAVKGFDICFISDLPEDTPPILVITSPTTSGNSIEIPRRTPISFSATVSDVEDDNSALAANLSWGINPNEPNFVGATDSFSTTLFVPGEYTVSATITDNGDNTVSDNVQITILGPVVQFTSPSDNTQLIATDVRVEWTADYMFLETADNEHFHLYVNPTDPNDFTTGVRISTKDFPNQLFWDLNAADHGITEGQNTVYIIAAESGHEEFTNPEAIDQITFTVSLPRTVPDVIGDTQADAVVTIESEDLLIGTIEEAFNASVPLGNVISQSPIGGSTVDVGSSVDLIVSKGAVQVSVPNVVGTTQMDAMTTLVNADLVVGAIIAVSDPFVASGTVISQDPMNGITVDAGSAVNLVVSSGIPQIDVPNVVGTARAVAESDIIAANLAVGDVTEENSNTVPIGDVIGQDPVSGSTVNEGSAVNLVISLGVFQTNVPEVVGNSQADAIIAIEAAGLTEGDIENAFSATVPLGNVISQNPVGGSSVDIGSQVDLLVSLGAVQVGVPDVVGTVQVEAEALILSADLIVGDVTEANSDTVAVGDVISQDPIAGVTVDAGSTVNLVISAGVVQISVPNLIGTVQADAESILLAANLLVGNITQENSNSVPSGAVIGQNPIGGSIVAEGSTVNLVISSGVLQVSVPNVVGVVRENAESMITAANLFVGGVTQANSDTVPLGAVISQNPIGGNTANAGSAVNIVVSLGKVSVGTTQLTVLDATDDTPLFDLVDGMVIQKSSIGNTPLGIIYNTDFNPNGVLFTLTGPINESRNEGPAPHSLFGDIGVNIQGKPFPVGRYTLVANPNSGPTITVNFEITEIDPACENFDLIVSRQIDPERCGSSDGEIIVEVNGSVSLPVSYRWSHDSNLNSGMASGLGEGNYTVTATDSAGCSKKLSLTLNGPPAPTVTLTSFANVLETVAPFDLKGGLPSGGIYQGQGVVDGTFNPSIGPGSYPITYSYTNSEGCSNSITRNIVVTSETANAALIVLDATTDIELFALTDGLQISKSVIGNTPLGIIYNTNLNPNGVFFTLTGPLNESRNEGPAPHSLFGDIGVNIQGKPFPVGNYTLSAKPNNGPTITVNFSVIEEAPVCLNYNVALQAKNDPTSCSGSDGSISLSITGASTPLVFEWSHDNNLQSAEAIDLSSGTYTVRVTDSNGCSDTVSILLTEPAAPNVTLDSFSSVMDTDTAFTLTGGLPLGGTYSGPGVRNGNFDPAIGVGSYTIIYSYVDSSTGCADSASARITVGAMNTELAVLSFTLVNAENDEDILTLTSGAVISYADLPTTNLNIRANTTSDVSSVSLVLTGALSQSSTESTAPYALFGDFPIGNYNANKFIEGNYIISATGYSLNGAGGSSGTPLTIGFELRNIVATSAKAVKEMTISPNPVDRIATLRFQTPKRVSDIYVYDVMGRLAKSFPLTSGEATTLQQIPVEDLPSGVYFVRIIDDKGKELQQQMAIRR